MNEKVIACTLDAGSFQQRLAWIADINANLLRSVHRDGLTLTLEYARSALDDVHTMVAREQSCCSFLNFDIAVDHDGITVSIVAPEEAREAAESLFEPFAARGPLQSDALRLQR